MYKVLVNFTDLQDNNYRYHAGDKFPRKGAKVSDERLEELSTDKNRRHKPMIKEVEDIKEFIPEESKASEEPKPKAKKGSKKKDAE